MGEAEQFLHALTGVEDPSVTFQTFADRPEDKSNETLVHVYNGTLSAYMTRLEKLNSQHAGIFVTVNETNLKGRRKGNMIGLRALFIDEDTGSLPSFPLPVSMLVQSGRGHHPYWFLRQGESMAAFEPALKQLIAYYHSDKQVCDINRVMRIPGFFWHKEDPGRLVKLMEVHPERIYSIAEVLAAHPVIPVVKPKRQTKPTAKDNPLHDRIKRASAYLSKIPAAISGSHGHSDTWNAALILVKGFSLPPETALEILTNEYNPRCSPPWSDKELQHKIDNAANDSTVADGYIVNAPSTLPRSIPDLAAIHSDVERHQAIKAAAAVAGVPMSAVAADVNRTRSLQAVPPPDDWRSKLIWREQKDGSRVLESCLNNAAVFLSHHEDWTGHIQQNIFSDTFESHSGPIDAPSGEWTDIHTAEAATWLQFQAHIMVPQETVHTAVMLAAQKNQFHPVRDYLGGLVWDGKQRLSTWLEVYCGAEESFYHNVVGKLWMIAAVARVMRPGCQADNTLILESPQGSRKSTLFRNLFDPWFSDDIDLLGSVASALQLRGVWGLELAELDSLHRSEITRVKAFLTRREDYVRKPYARLPERWKRQNIFCGSTNKEAYLQDETGARRFWCVRCGKLDPETLSAERDQLWAEAYALFTAGEEWWVADSFTLREVEAEQEARFAVDSWENQIEKALKTWEIGFAPEAIQEITMGNVLSRIGVDTARQGMTEQKRAGACLKRLGYTRKKKRVGERTPYIWEKEGEQK